jgi:hypothetical protein
VAAQLDALSTAALGRDRVVYGLDANFQEETVRHGLRVRRAKGPANSACGYHGAGKVGQAGTDYYNQ